jgi:hypothetical protein
VNRACFWKGEKEMKKVLVIAVAMTLVLSAYALAGMNPNNKVAVHVGTVKKCSNLVFVDCHDIVTSTTICGGMGAYYIVPVHYDLVCTTVLEGALTWPAGWGTIYYGTQCYGSLAIEVTTIPGYYGYSFASTVPVSSWSEPACARWFYYATPEAGVVCPTANTTTGFIGVVDCTTDPEPLPDPAICLFCAGVCGGFGDDPCEPTAVEPSTWGSIKNMFK